MANDEDFDDIINNMGDADNEEDDFDNPLDVIDNYWKAFHPGEIFVRGVLIVESTTSSGNRALRYESSKSAAEWDVLGMLNSVQQQIQAQNVLESLGMHLCHNCGDEQKQAGSNFCSDKCKEDYDDDDE